MKTPIISLPQRKGICRFASAIALGVLLLGPSVLQAQVDTVASWSGGGGAGVTNWTTAANWSSTSPNLAPPANPMTQAVPGNGSGKVSFTGTTTVNMSYVDQPWTIGVLDVDFNKGITFSGADLTIQQATSGSTLTLANGAIQVRNNSGASVARNINFTNNIIFDNSVNVADPASTSHLIIQRAGNLNGQINFYGNVSQTGTNETIDVRTVNQVSFFGGINFPTTSLVPENLSVAQMADTARVNFYGTANTLNGVSQNRGVISIRNNNALPITSHISSGGSLTRVYSMELNGFNQTLAYLVEEGTQNAARTLSTGGGYLTINDNAMTNEWNGWVISGTGGLIKNGNGKLTIDRTQTYTGGTTIGNGVLQLGNGGAGGLLASTCNITNNATLIINSTDNFTQTATVTGTGSLLKLAANTVALNGTNTYSGATTVGAGTLSLGASGALSNSVSITLSNATFDASAAGGLTRGSGQSLNGRGIVKGDVVANSGSIVTVGNSIGTLSLSNNLTLNAATINMELGSDPLSLGGTVNDFINLRSNVTLSGVSTFNLTPVASLGTATNYTLLTYGGTLTGAAGNLAAQSTSTRYVLDIVDPATTPGAIQAKVTAAYTVIWRGGDAGNPTLWDTGTTTNWLVGGNPDAFLANDNVIFDDSAVTNLVTLSSTVQPISIVTSNTTAKSFGLGGTGSVSASGTLTISGNGSLTLSNSTPNSVGGGIIMNAGSLTIANPVAQPLGVVALNNSSVLNIVNDFNDSPALLNLNGGTVAFNQATDQSFGGVFAGTSTMVKQGVNTLTMLGNNNGFGGTMQVNNGVLKKGISTCFGSNVVVANAASLDTGGFKNGPPAINTTFTIQGTGYNNSGAIFNSGSYEAMTFTNCNVILANDTTLSTAITGWEFYYTTITGNGYKLTKVGTNDFWLGVNQGADNDIGDIDVKEGLFGLQFGTRLGQTNKTLTLRTNATLGLYRTDFNGNTTTGWKNIVLEDQARLANYFNGDVSFTGLMNVSGTNPVAQVTTNARSLRFDGNLTGPGWLSTMSFNSYLTLTGTNLGTGGIDVNTGFLRLMGSGLAFSNAYTINVHTIPLSGSGVVQGPAVPRVEMMDLGLGPVTIPTNVTIYLNSGGGGDYRTTFGVSSGGGSGHDCRGTLVLTGDGTISLNVNSAGLGMTISGPITNQNYTGSLGLRGAGTCEITGRVTLGAGSIGKNNATGIYTISSTGNDWSETGDSSGIFRIGANDAFCVTAPVRAGDRVDLNGFNQTIGGLYSSGFVYNDNAFTASLLTISSGTNSWTFDGVIQDNHTVSGSTVALTLATGTQLLTGANTYTGPTIIQAGATLGGTGSLLSSVTNYGVLSPGASIGTFTISNSLTLVAGSTNFFEVDAGALTQDLVAGLSNVTYGGTLVISNLSGTPFANGMSFKLFDSLAYSGSFAAISPAAPDNGLAWDTSSLTIDGTLKVVMASSSAPQFSSIVSAGPNTVQLTFTGAVSSAYSVRFHTNVAIPIASWQVLTSGTITTSPFSIQDTTATNRQRFYRVSTP